MRVLAIDTSTTACSVAVVAGKRIEAEAAEYSGNTHARHLMARVEERLWWYRGLRDVLGRWLRERRADLPAHPRVLDAGELELGELLRAVQVGG